MTAPTTADVVRLEPRRRRPVDQRSVGGPADQGDPDGGMERKRLLTLVAIAVVALTAVLVFASPVLDVDEVAVVGTRHTSAQTVADAAGIRTGTALVLADLDSAESAVETLPWIAEATVERSVDGVVEVRVVERDVAAVVGDGGASVLVDRSGYVIAPLADAPPEAVAGPPLVEVVAGTAPEVGRRVTGSLIGAVGLAERLRHDPPGAVRAVLVDPLRLELRAGGQVLLGDDLALDDKITAFRTVHARVDQACVETIDVRVPTHPVLTRRSSCS